MKARFTSILVVAVLASSCRNTQRAHGDAHHRSLVRGYQSGISEPCVVIARTTEEWQDLWARHAALSLPQPERPAIDFDRDMVVCVVLGSRPTFGYAVEIDHLDSQGDRLLVAAVEKKPAADAILSQVVTQPFHMIVVPRRAGTAELILR